MKATQDATADCASTMSKANFGTFEFMEEDYSRILLKDSLFNDTTKGKANVSVKSPEKLQEKEVRLYLHAVTLSNYVRVNPPQTKNQ